MDHTAERVQDQAAYRRLRDRIKETFPPGRFIAISGGQIVADAERFTDLRKTLAGMGKDPAHVLIVQAGVDYPESAMIFAGHEQR